MNADLVPVPISLPLANTLANRVQQFLEVEFKGRAWRTRYNVRQVLEEFEIFVGHKEITREVLIAWDSHQEKLGWKNYTINQKGKHIRRFLRWCEDNGYIVRSPGRFLPVHQVIKGPLPSIYTEQEYECIKDYTRGTINYYLTVIGYRTGMSLVDCCHLRWSCINMEELYLRTARIKLIRNGPSAVFTVPILANSDIHQLLSDLSNTRVVRYHNQNDDYVNPDLKGQYDYWQYKLSQRYITMLRELGIQHKSFKNFRNTFISHLANSGMNLALACKMTGHRDPSIFTAYIRPDVEAMRTGLQAAFQWAASKETVKELRTPKL